MIGPLRQLACPTGCVDGRFEALNAPMMVDRNGRYLSHDASMATYVCNVCRMVAIDVAAAGRAMRTDGPAPLTTLTCPACGVVMLPPEDDEMAVVVECPACEARFAVEEGMPRLHGAGEDPSAN